MLTHFKSSLSPNEMSYLSFHIYNQEIKESINSIIGPIKISKPVKNIRDIGIKKSSSFLIEYIDHSSSIIEVKNVFSRDLNDSSLSHLGKILYSTFFMKLIESNEKEEFTPIFIKYFALIHEIETNCNLNGNTHVSVQMFFFLFPALVNNCSVIQILSFLGIEKEKYTITI